MTVKDNTTALAVDRELSPSPYYANVSVNTPIYLVGYAQYSGGAIRMRGGTTLSQLYAVRVG